jgi:hypothetical protein
MKQKKNYTKKKKGGSSGAVIASGALGTYAGHTLAKRYVRQGQTWFSHLLLSYLDLVWYLAKSFIKGGTFVYKEAVVYSIDYFFGRDITKASVEDLTKEVKEKLIKSARMAAAISEDPVAMKNLQETGKISAEILNDIIIDMQEPMMELTNTAVDLLEMICLNLTAAGVDISIGVIGAALGQIPFLGALVNLFITTGRAVNKSSSIFKNSVTTIGKMGELASSGLQKPLDTANQGKFKLMGMQDKINDALSVSGNVVDDVKNPQQKGGGFTCRFKKCKNIRSVPLKTRKRIMKAGYRRKRLSRPQ